MYIITFENKFYRAFYLNLFEKYTQAYDIFFIENENTILHNDDEKIRKFVFTFINMYLHILRHFFLDDSENDAASCVYESQASYTLRMCVVPDLRETDVQQVTDYQSTRDYTDFTILIILDGSVKMNR